MDVLKMCNGHNIDSTWWEIKLLWDGKVSKITREFWIAQLDYCGGFA